MRTATNYLDSQRRQNKSLRTQSRSWRTGERRSTTRRRARDKQKPPSVYLLNRESKRGLCPLRRTTPRSSTASPRCSRCSSSSSRQLVTMTTMTRMLKSNAPIGALQALGYSGDHRLKYVSYARPAIGALIGFFGSNWLFRWVIGRRCGMLLTKLCRRKIPLHAGLVSFCAHFDGDSAAVLIKVTLLACTAGLELTAPVIA